MTGQAIFRACCLLALSFAAYLQVKNNHACMMMVATQVAKTKLT
jgi:hypothetical protein